MRGVFAEKVPFCADLEKCHQLRACLETLQKEDELVISKLDHLERSQVEVINRLADLQGKGIHIRTLDGLTITKGRGRLALLVFALLTGLAEVERSQIQERTRVFVELRKKIEGDLLIRPEALETKKLILYLKKVDDSCKLIGNQAVASATMI